MALNKNCELSICCNDYSTNLIAEDVEKIWLMLRTLQIDKLHTKLYGDELKQIRQLLEKILTSSDTNISTSEDIISKIDARISDLETKIDTLETTLKDFITTTVNTAHNGSRSFINAQAQRLVNTINSNSSQIKNAIDTNYKNHQDQIDNITYLAWSMDEEVVKQIKAIIGEQASDSEKEDDDTSRLFD